MPDRRKVLSGLGLTLVGLSTGLRTSFAQAVAKKGGSLVVGIDNNPPALSILANSATLTNCTAGQLFNTLIKLSPDYKILPNLARTWAKSADGLSYTFQLEPDVKWHDGVPFTSEDVRYSMLELNGKYNALARSTYAAIKEIQTPDEHTVIVILNKPDPAFFPWGFSQQEQAQIHPKHIYEGSDPSKNPANLKPVGTGAFKFSEWQKGSHLIFDRNPDYFHKDAVLVDRLIFQIIPDPGARQLALENGEVDYIPFFCLSAASADALQSNSDVQVIEAVRPARGEILAYMNLRHEQLKKKEVRQAISFAIDRDALVKLVLNGRGKAATGPIRSDHAPFYNGDVKHYSRDIDQANKLLDRAGAARNGDTRFSIRLSYQGSGEGGGLQAAAEIMREQLKDVGIALELVPGDPGTVWDKAYLEWDFDLAMGSFFTGPDPKISVSPKYVTSNIRKQDGGNLMGYSNPKVDELLAAADDEIDDTKRADLYKQAQVLLVEEVPALWLWEKTYPSAARAGLVGIPSGANHWEPYEGVGWTS
jgi:peptide/nickel transport system substrate-binding protein